MINLENIHKAMNNTSVQNVVNSLMFEWTFEEGVEENLKEWISSISRMYGIKLTLEEELAVETLFYAMTENAREKGEWRIN